MNMNNRGATRAVAFSSILFAGLVASYSQRAEAALQVTTKTYTFTDYYYRHVTCTGLCDDYDVLDHVTVSCSVSVENNVEHPHPSEGNHFIGQFAYATCRTTYPVLQRPNDIPRDAIVRNWGNTDAAIFRETERRYYPGDSHQTFLSPLQVGPGYTNYDPGNVSFYLGTQHPGLCWGNKRTYQARWVIQFEVYSPISKQSHRIAHPYISNWLYSSNSVVGPYYPWC